MTIVEPPGGYTVVELMQQTLRTHELARATGSEEFSTLLRCTERPSGVEVMTSSWGDPAAGAPRLRAGFL